MSAAKSHGPAVEPRRRDEVLEARREHEDRGRPRRCRTPHRGTPSGPGPRSVPGRVRAPCADRSSRSAARPARAANSTTVDGRRRAPTFESSDDRRVLRSAATNAINRDHGDDRDDAQRQDRPSRRGRPGRGRHGGRHRTGTAATPRRHRARRGARRPPAISSAGYASIATRWRRVSPSARNVAWSTLASEISRVNTIAIATTPARAATPAKIHNASGEHVDRALRAVGLDGEPCTLKSARRRRRSAAPPRRPGHIGCTVAGPDPERTRRSSRSGRVRAVEGRGQDQTPPAAPRSRGRSGRRTIPTIRSRRRGPARDGGGSPLVANAARPAPPSTTTHRDGHPRPDAASPRGPHRS